MRGLVAALLVFAIACSDTRARPVPPIIALVFDTTQVIRSPGLLVGTVEITASGGLDFIHMTLATGDSTFLLDSLEGYAGETEIVRPIQWLITPGLAPGTTLHFRVMARDFVDFETADTIQFKTRP